MEAGLIADNGAPPHVHATQGKTYLKRSPQDDAQLHHRVVGRLADLRLRRQLAPPHAARPDDPAKLAMVQAHTGTAGDALRLSAGVRAALCAGAATAGCDPIQPEWAGQEAAAIPDNWSIGLCFLHNVFAREHNVFVDEFRKVRAGNAGRGFRPAQSRQADRRRSPTGKVSDDELFEIARLVVAAEIAKIHTIEWTTQLLYDEPLYVGMNANWSGLFKDDVRRRAAKLAADVIVRRSLSELGNQQPKVANQFYSALAAGPGIVGTGSDLRPIRHGVERRGQPLRLAVQLPGGVHLGLPAASAGAGHDRVPRAFGDAERDREARAGDRHLPRQGDARRCARAGCPTGRCRWGASGSACCCCRIIRSSCRTSTSVRASTPRSTCRRSTSSATASAACRASTSSAARSDCASSPASTTSSTSGCPNEPAPEATSSRTW